MDREKEKKAFLLCFTAVIWRRIFCTMILYNNLRKLPSDSENLLKCLKYNLLAPTGFVNEIKPYILKTLKNGFLMPGDYKDNMYVKRAIKLFGDAYQIYKKGGNNKEEKKFVSSYISDVFFNSFNEKNQEIIDCINTGTENICDLIDSWDIELGLVPPDPYIDLIKYFLFSVVLL